MTATARALGLHRVTVQRWKTHHPRFIAELAHRAALSQIDTTLKAQRALDIAMNIILKDLASGSADARRQTALRLLASPRFARLAAFPTPVSLRQTLSQLQQLRTPDVPPDAPAPAPADPPLLNELAAQIDAPIPADPPKVPKPKPQPTKKLPWEPPAKPTLRELLADRPLRPDLLAAFERYGCTPQQVEIAARRPDITPFDIHCFAITVEPSPLTVQLLSDDDGIYIPVHGVENPLNTNVLAKMITRGLVTHLAGHDLAGYSASADPDTKLLTLTHPAKPTITIPHAHLWRDALMTPTGQPRGLPPVEAGGVPQEVTVPSDTTRENT